MQSAEQESLKLTLDRPVVLVGMMGAGKTSIGKILARALNLEFFDSDALIEKEAGMPVTEVFEKFGEPKFRAVEARILADLAQAGPSVIATGGGALISADTLRLLKDGTIMIWIDVETEELWARLAHAKNRPLLKVENPKQRLIDLLAVRKPLYEQAHTHLRFAEESPEQCLAILIKALSDGLNNGTF